MFSCKISICATNKLKLGGVEIKRRKKLIKLYLLGSVTGEKVID